MTARRKWALVGAILGATPIASIAAVLTWMHPLAPLVPIGFVVLLAVVFRRRMTLRQSRYWAGLTWAAFVGPATFAVAALLFPPGYGLPTGPMAVLVSATSYAASMGLSAAIATGALAVSDSFLKRPDHLSAMGEGRSRS
jgi:hypothetical protein